MTVVGASESNAALDCEHGPVAVMLELMKPANAFGRLVGKARKVWRDSAKSGNAGHACYLAGPNQPSAGRKRRRWALA
jgi:hypothetical protein